MWKTRLLEYVGGICRVDQISITRWIQPRGKTAQAIRVSTYQHNVSAPRDPYLRTY